eukprot:13120394-Ditylum_brightwellii.AAC.1
MGPQRKETREGVELKHAPASTPSRTQSKLGEEPMPREVHLDRSFWERRPASYRATLRESSVTRKCHTWESIMLMTQ